MNLVVLFATSFLVALSGALMPGPLLTVTVGHSPRYGWTFGPLAIAGHALLELGLISLIFIGAAPLLKSTLVQAFVGLAGGAILVWMGYGMLTIGSREIDADETGEAQGRGRPVLLGVLASVSNPYWTLWWATVGLAYLMVAAERGPAGVAVFFAGHISGDLAWYTLVSSAAARGLKLTGGRLYGWVLKLCAAALILLGGWFVWYGARLLRAP